MRRWSRRRPRSRRSAPAASPPSHDEAVDEALRLLERRDLTRAELETRLGKRGVEPDAAASAAAALERTGIVDDGRYARLRASALAESDWGDEGIRVKLAGEGVSDEAIAEALESLPAERLRAAAIVSRQGLSRKTLASLARRGFAEDTVEAASLDLAE